MFLQIHSRRTRVEHDESDGVDLETTKPAVLMRNRIAQVICRVVMADDHCLHATNKRVVGWRGLCDNHARRRSHESFFQQHEIITALLCITGMCPVKCVNRSKRVILPVDPSNRRIIELPAAAVAATARIEASVRAIPR